MTEYNDDSRMAEVDGEKALPVIMDELARFESVLGNAASQQDVASLLRRFAERFDGLDIIRHTKSDRGHFGLIERAGRFLGMMTDKELVENRLRDTRSRIHFVQNADVVQLRDALGSSQSLVNSDGFDSGTLMYAEYLNLFVNGVGGGYIKAMHDFASVADNYAYPESEESTSSDRAVSLSRTILGLIESHVARGELNEAQNLRDYLFNLVDSGFSLDSYRRNEINFSAVPNRNYQTRLWLPQTLGPIENGIYIEDVQGVSAHVAFMDQRLDRKNISKEKGE